MMYVQIPIFSGYANIAICPANGTVCYMIDDVQKNQNLYSEMNPKSKTFLPFYENHHYVLYPTTDDKVDDGILYFHSEELMKEYILEHLGTKYVTGRSLSLALYLACKASLTSGSSMLATPLEQILLTALPIWPLASMDMTVFLSLACDTDKSSFLV